jgi:hypothetical protein
MMTAKKKLELALVENYFLNLKYSEPAIIDLQILTSKGGETKTTPRIEIVAGQLEITEGFEGTDTGELSCEVSVSVFTSADDDDEIQADIVTNAVECLLGDSSRAVLAMNKPATRADSRPIKGIFLYDLEIIDASDEAEERQRVTVYQCSAIFRNDNGGQG